MRRRNHWKRYVFTTICMILSAAFMSYGAPDGAGPDQLRSVTYVSDEWVINFWNSESDHMEEELAQIAADGFNSIILAVPWREFQPSVNPIQYSDYTFAKLDRIMRAAGEQGLWVSLRVGYTWDYCPGESPQNRYKKLLGDETMRSAWLSYAQRLYESVSGYENFYGGFITWEDFWNYVEDAPGQYGSSKAGAEEAKRIGFQKYLEDNYTLEQVNEYYGPAKSFDSFEQIGIPKRESPAYKLFFEFYDNFLNELLIQTQQVFPDLSMEVRLDVDPVQDINGETVGAAHYSTFPCGESSYTALMYSVSMGQAFERQLTAAEAVAMMEHQLNLVKAHNAGKPIYIDQLLYMDTTPGFGQNARLLEEERNAFLTGISGILRNYTNGYAVWTYRNYANNGVFNSQFALEGQGWDANRVTFVRRDDSNQARIQKGGSLSQNVGGRITSKGQFENHVRFMADSDRPVKLTVIMGSKTKEVTVDGKKQYDLNFGCFDYDQIRFRAAGEVYLDNISVYNFVQDGQLHDLDGSQLPCLEGIRQLNQMLNE